MKAISDGSSRLPFEIQVLYRMMKWGWYHGWFMFYAKCKK
jgi:hypothetical protein